MKDNIELKRPWTIKVFVTIFGLLFGMNLILFLTDPSKPWVLIYDLIILVSIFGIWQGRIWARNLFFIVTLPFVFLFGIASGASILGFGSQESILKELYLAFAMLSIPFLLMMIFLKPSTEWFNRLNENKLEKKLDEFSWQFQLMVIVTAMGCSVLGSSIAPSLLPLAKEFMLNFSTYYARFAILIGFESLAFCIGNMAILFPFSVLMGYWKKGNVSILIRLITIGSIFPLLLFSPGKTLLLFSGFFISKVIVIACIAYGGLVLGGKIKESFVKLKQLNKIPS